MIDAVPDPTMEPDDTAQMLRDLVWLHALIATELIQVTENTSALLRNGFIPDSCIAEHNALRNIALLIAERCRPGEELRQHIIKHQ
jgi:hypothetical protein